MAPILDLLRQFTALFYFVVFPVLLLIGLGYLLKRALGLDMHTLKTLNFYGTLPVVVFLSVVTSTVTRAEVWAAAMSMVLLALFAGIITMLYAVAVRIAPRHRSAMVLSTTIPNLGNFGIPLQDLAFRSIGASADALGLHAYLLVTNNLLTFTAGVFVASGAKSIRKQLGEMLKFPPIYALAAALLVSFVRSKTGWELPGEGTPLRPFWDVILQIRGAFIALALITLGAQLAGLEPTEHRYPVASTVFLRLVAGPVIGMAVVLLLGMRGLMAQVFLLTAASPTAVNTVLLSMEFDNEPEFASRVVFYTTLLSPVTVTIVLLLVRSGWFPIFAF